MLFRSFAVIADLDGNGLYAANERVPMLKATSHDVEMTATLPLATASLDAAPQAATTSDVQKAQRCAAIGIALRHSGQSRVVDSTSGSVRRRAIR